MHRCVALILLTACSAQSALASPCGNLEGLIAQYDKLLEENNNSSSLAIRCNYKAQMIQVQEKIVKYRAYANKCGKMVAFDMDLNGTNARLNHAKGNFKSLCN